MIQYETLLIFLKWMDVIPYCIIHVTFGKWHLYLKI